MAGNIMFPLPFAYGLCMVLGPRCYRQKRHARLHDSHAQVTRSYHNAFRSSTLSTWSPGSCKPHSHRFAMPRHYVLRDA